MQVFFKSRDPQAAELPDPSQRRMRFVRPRLRRGGDARRLHRRAVALD